MKIFICICIVLCTALCGCLSFVPFFLPELPKNQWVCPDLPTEAYGTEIPVPHHCDAVSAVLVDADSGRVLFQQNMQEKRGMASTTKIMTALTVLEYLPTELLFEIPLEVCGVEGSSVYLQPGEVFSVEELLYCLLLESGNDAAAALAVCCCGSIQSFVEKMNLRAAELGLKNTHFSNPHGLSDPNHYSTAEDLAVITAEAMKYPLFRQIVATKTFCVTPKNGTKRFLVNHNKLLFGFEGALGVKTGYTMADGKCLVSAAERDGITLVAVTLADSAPTDTHRALLEYGFSNCTGTTVCLPGGISTELAVEGGTTKHITLSNTRSVRICAPKGLEITVSIKAPAVVFAPIRQGEILGCAVVECNGKVIDIIFLEAEGSAECKRVSFWKKYFGE